MRSEYVFNCLHVIVTVFATPDRHDQFEITIGFWPLMWHSRDAFLQVIWDKIKEVHDADAEPVYRIDCCAIGSTKHAEPQTPDWYNEREGKFSATEISTALTESV